MYSWARGDTEEYKEEPFCLSHQSGKGQVFTVYWCYSCLLYKVTLMSQVHLVELLQDIFL